MLLMVFATSAFMAGSVLGEHPWDSDFDGDGDLDGGDRPKFVGDTTLIFKDTSVVSSPNSGPSGGSSLVTFVTTTMSLVASIL
jgi:hypothetical protein